LLTLGVCPWFLADPSDPSGRSDPGCSDCGTRLDGYPFLAAVGTGIPEGSEPLAGGKRSATSGG
jgi:hypothetical protein